MCNNLASWQLVVTITPAIVTITDHKQAFTEPTHKESEIRRRKVKPETHRTGSSYFEKEWYSKHRES